MTTFAKKGDTPAVSLSFAELRDYLGIPVATHIDQILVDTENRTVSIQLQPVPYSNYVALGGPWPLTSRLAIMRPAAVSPRP